MMECTQESGQCRSKYSLLCGWKLRQMETQGVHMKGVLPLLLSWRVGTRDFFPDLAALVGPVQNIFTSSYTISIHLSPSLSTPGKQSCHVACLRLYPETQGQATQHDCLPRLLGNGEKVKKCTVWKIKYCTGLTSAAKAGQNSIVPAWGAQRTNQPRKDPFHMYSKSPLLPQFQQSAGATPL